MQSSVGNNHSAIQSFNHSYLHVGKCEYCDTFLVVMNTESGSVLPVEVDNLPDGKAGKNIKISDDEMFDGNKYKSHLLKCEKQRKAWLKKKWKYVKQRNPLFAFVSSTLKEKTR